MAAMSTESNNTTTGISVPFRLDDSLGPNRADILLVMCRLSTQLGGRFTVAVSKTSFQVTSVDITATPFDLEFAKDFVVNITDLTVERDETVESAPGTLTAVNDQGEFQVQAQVPITVRMLAHMQSTAEWITFHTPFTLKGSISNNIVSLSGSFNFQIEGYGESFMRTKFGTVDVTLNASSWLHFELAPNPDLNWIKLRFASREAKLDVSGDFTVGLDGLALRVAALSLDASPLVFPALLKMEQIHISLDRRRELAPVTFALSPDERYHVHANIPARLSTQLSFLGFDPQPFEVGLSLKMEGGASLEADLGLNLQEEIGVQIADGAVNVEIEAVLQAQPTALTEAPKVEVDSRRSLYAALRAVPEGQFGWQVAEIRAVIKGEDRTGRLLAVGALERIGGREGIDLLIAALEDAAPEVRVAAANALGNLQATAAAAALLARFRSDLDQDVRIAAFLALAAFPTPDWLDAAIPGTKDANEVMRCQAVLVLGQRGGASAVGALIGALDDSDPFVRLCAGIGLLTSDNKEAVDTIIRLAQSDQDICVRMVSSIVLGQTQDEEARRTLQILLETSQEVFVRQAALYGLAKQQNGPAPA